MEQKTILIVEDVAMYYEALLDKLSFENYKVLIAKDGLEGLEASLNKHPDLIILDIVMPRMDGMTMLKKLRENSWGKTAKVILLTNLPSADEQRNRDITETEPTYYFEKSEIKLSDLLDRIKDLLKS